MKNPFKNALLGSTLLLSSILFSSCENETLDTSTVESFDSKDISIISDTDSLWPNNTITYHFDSNFSKYELFEEAVHHWELFTTIDFVEATNPSDIDLIVYYTSGNCRATVGYRANLPTSNAVYISDSCDMDDIIHELGHVVGLHHEHNRNDRDEYITVNFENIQEAALDQFVKNEDNGINTLEFTPFDFESIMLYSSDAASIGEGLNSMVKLNGSTFERYKVLSKYDIIGIESLYREGSPKKIAISALINGGKYISSENGNKEITSNRTAIGTWETFTVHPIGGGLLAIQGNNNKFLSVDDDGALKFNANSVGDSETFTATYSSYTINDKLYYTISHEDFSDLYIDDSNGEIKIDNSGGGGQDTLFAIEILD